MLNIIKDRVGDTLSIRLNGSLIGECVNLEMLIGPTPAQLRVNCKHILRLNSNGVRAWIRYFQSVTDRGTKVFLTDCSPAIVDKLNDFRSFACGAKVESIYVPYFCHGCKKELIGLYSTEELLRARLKVPDLNCPSCGQNAEIDDLPDQYFHFLKRELGARSEPVKIQPISATSALQEPSHPIQLPPLGEGAGRRTA